jgi:hypothetical protein
MKHFIGFLRWGIGNLQGWHLHKTPNNACTDPCNERYSSLQTHCSNSPRSQATHHKPRGPKQFMISARTDPVSCIGQSCHTACHGDSGGKEDYSWARTGSDRHGSARHRLQGNTQRKQMEGRALHRLGLAQTPFGRYRNSSGIPDRAKRSEGSKRAKGQ